MLRLVPDQHLGVLVFLKDMVIGFCQLLQLRSSHKRKHLAFLDALLIAEAKGVKFKIELSSDAFVYLPKGQLKKAISNILSNAVNYTEAGQSISVVFDKNKLSVSNECSILPPEQLQHIFEPFYRPDLAHSQATGGNGLGLYIVQTILDKLRLKYQFVPMPNDRGMSFTIQF